MLTRRLACLCVLLTLPTVARADLFIEMTTTAREGEQSRKIVTLAWFAKDRAANQGIDKTKRIIRFDRELIWDVDPETKGYTETTFAKMKQLQKERHAKKKAQAVQLRKMLKDPKLDAATRKRIEQVLESMEGAKYRIRKGAATQILGHTAVQYDVTINGKPFMTVWATRALGNVEEFNRLQTLSGSMQPNLMDELRKIQGVWLKWQTADGMRSAIATKISTDPIADQVFSVPAGYKKR